MTKSRLISAVTAFLLAIPCIFAVTDAEMEQARVIATQCYLRYANNGSGYLDDIHPKTMKELESKLKAKEKENIKAFNAIRIPADYASWDKKKLVEYWAATAFNSGGLLAEGKAARSRVRARINAMNVSAPNLKRPTPSIRPCRTPRPAARSPSLSLTPKRIQKLHPPTLLRQTA